MLSETGCALLTIITKTGDIMEERQKLLKIAMERLEKDRKEKNFPELPFSENTLQCMRIICFLDSLDTPRHRCKPSLNNNTFKPRALQVV